MMRSIPYPRSAYSDRGTLIVPSEEIIAHTKRIPERGEYLEFFFRGHDGIARYQVVGVIPGKVALRFAPRTLAEVA